MKVLVGVDGSSNSYAAVEFIGRLLSSERDELVLLYATPQMSFGGEEQLDLAVEQRARAALSRTVLDEALVRLPEAWRSRAEQMAVAGAANVELLNAVEKTGADLVTVGFRGAGLMERFVLGSVSRAVVHSAKVPVLVVKSEPTGDKNVERPAGAVERSTRVLVTFDEATTGKKVAAILARFTWPHDTIGSVMTVVPPLHLTELPPWLRQAARDPDVQAMADAWQREHQQSVEQARGALEQFQRTLPKQFAEGKPIVKEGRPAEKIIDTLAQQSFDLAVVGSRGSGAVQRLLLGSTSSQVITQAPCSVLVVR